MSDLVPDKLSPPAPIAPVGVTLIGTGTGDGGAPLTTGTVGTTPDHQPNVRLNVISPLMAISIRFVNLFLTVLVGLVVAGMTPSGASTLQATDFVDLVLTCASLSLPAAGLGLIKDCATVFSGLERKYPLSTGAV